MAAADQMDLCLLADKRLDDPQLLRQARKALLKDNGLFSHFPPSWLDALPCRRWTTTTSRFNGHIWQPTTAKQQCHYDRSARSKLQQHSSGIGAETKVAGLCLHKHRYSLTHARRVLKRKKAEAAAQEEAEAGEVKTGASSAAAADKRIKGPSIADSRSLLQQARVSSQPEVVDLDMADEIIISDSVGSSLFGTYPAGCVRRHVEFQRSSPIVLDDAEQSDERVGCSAKYSEKEHGGAAADERKCADEDDDDVEMVSASVALTPPPHSRRGCSSIAARAVHRDMAITPKLEHFGQSVMEAAKLNGAIKSVETVCVDDSDEGF